MRIVGGEHKGRRITAPKGDGTRPTTDRTREAVFSALTSRAAILKARVVDLFAGSGALGLEALSRGASWCLFVETNAAARGAIRENIEALELFGATRIHRRSATGLGLKPASAGAPFSLGFLDPPYRQGLAPLTLARLHEGQWLADGALLVVEQARDEAPPDVKSFDVAETRHYGETTIHYVSYRR